MGDYKAFLTIPRKEAGYRPVHDRILDFGEVEQTLNVSSGAIFAKMPNCAFSLDFLRNRGYDAGK